LRTDEDGSLVAEPLKWGGSSDFVSFARANGLVVVPAGGGFAAGDRAKCLRLPA
jgi:molybdopterin biosynthesis enzyme